LTTGTIQGVSDQALEIQEHMKRFPEIADSGVDHYTIRIHPCRWGACCVFPDKRIDIDPSLYADSAITPQLEMSVLFELANLSQEREFRSLLGRVSLIAPEEFVSNWERLEHRSALMVKKIIRDRFPIEQWPDYPYAYTPENFNLHYLLQQAGGHSQEIFERHARSLGANAEYNGTWNGALQQDELRFIFSLIDLKIRSQDPEQRVSLPAIKDYQFLQSVIRRGANDPREANRSLYARLAPRIDEIEAASITPSE